MHFSVIGHDGRDFGGRARLYDLVVWKSALRLVWRVMFVSTLFSTGVFGIFIWSQMNGSTLEEARTYAVNTLVVMEIFYLFSVRYLRARP